MSSYVRLNAYRVMWLFVFFDLPTTTKTDRKNYASFRKKLQKDGFSMMQYSVYCRHSVSIENAEVHKKRVRKNMPPKGEVTILMITDKQYALMENFWGKTPKPPPKMPQQLEMF